MAEIAQADPLNLNQLTLEPVNTGGGKVWNIILTFLPAAFWRMP